MVSDDRVPVVIAVGDFVNRSRKVEDAIEPLELLATAFDNAINDTKLSQSAVKKLRDAIDSVNVVRTWTWPYPDLAKALAERLRINANHIHNSDHGGHSPALLFDEAARRISKGESKAAIVAGAEALASLAACAAAQKLPPAGWTNVDQDVTSVFSPTTRELKPDIGAIHGIGNPVHIYPLYENAYRAHKQQSIKDNLKESAELYAEFAKVAESNPNAWTQGPALSAEAIGTVSKKNRMICFPYPLLQNAFNNVNMAAVCIVTSLRVARDLGLDSSRLIYALGGAGTCDADNFWERPNFHTSPCISQSLDAAIEVSDIQKDDIDIYDFYSCFPIVPKLAAEHLELPFLKPSRPITLLGGLTSFGGAGNSYSMPAINEMVRQLRAGKGKTGLVLANGGSVTYQHVVCLSTKPRAKLYPSKNPLAKTTGAPSPQLTENADGDATIETYTVDYKRDGTPGRGLIVGRLSDGSRFVANHADDATLKALSSIQQEPIGRSGTVTNVDGRNLFKFLNTARL